MGYFIKKEEEIKELSRALGLHDEDGKDRETVVKAWLDSEKDHTLSYLLTALEKIVPGTPTLCIGHGGFTNFI